MFRVPKYPLCTDCPQVCLAFLAIRSTVVVLQSLCLLKSPLFYLVVSKCKSSDAGQLDTPKRSCQVLPFNKKVNVLNLIKKNNVLRSKIYGKKKSICEIAYFNL